MISQSLANDTRTLGYDAKGNITSKKPIDYFKKRYTERNTAMAKAYLSGHYTLESVGIHFGVSYATVSRAVKQFECQM